VGDERHAAGAGGERYQEQQKQSATGLKLTHAKRLSAVIGHSWAL